MKRKSLCRWCAAETDGMFCSQECKDKLALKAANDGFGTHDFFVKQGFPHHNDLVDRVHMFRVACEALDRLPPGEWEVSTSCSYRRISTVGGVDGDVLHATVHPADKWPDLSWNADHCQALCDLVNQLRSIVQRVDEADAQRARRTSNV